MTLFSFPALAAGPPSRRNWYQELLDHPDCHGPREVSEAYESHRNIYMANSLKAFVSDNNPVKPDLALISHIKRQKIEQEGGESMEDLKDLEVNCLGISARPSPSIVSKIQEIQDQISILVGPDFYSMPASHLHIAMVELAHRHTLAHLHSVSTLVGQTRLQAMLDMVSTLPSKPRLVSPSLSFDSMGIALSFLPDSAQEYTYHHLRADMHALALESSGSFDMCYTAPSAHVTLGRFVGNSFFSSRESRQMFVTLVAEINENLQTSRNKANDWVLGEPLSLELQAGYLKFGARRDDAEMLGEVPESLSCSSTHR